MSARRYGDGPSLHEVLLALGFGHAKARCRSGGWSPRGDHEIYDLEIGEILTTATAGEAWAWLRETGRL